MPRPRQQKSINNPKAALRKKLRQSNGCFPFAQHHRAQNRRHFGGIAFRSARQVFEHPRKSTYRYRASNYSLVRYLIYPYSVSQIIRPVKCFFKINKKKMGELMLSHLFWSKWRDSNSRPPVPETGALPAALHLVAIPIKYTITHAVCQVLFEKEFVHFSAPHLSPARKGEPKLSFNCLFIRLLLQFLNLEPIHQQQSI